MFTLNPAVIPRNHKIEEVIQSVQEKTNDFSRLNIMLNVLSNPYQETHKESIEYMRSPSDQERIDKTFCGT
jgi:uncharacterized protein YdiU (UPF0061 family)